MRKLLTRNEWYILLAFIAVKLLIHFLTNTNYDLHRDSFLYFSLSENLDWGYASVPPFIGFITKVSTFLFGYSAFSLNVFPAIAGAVSLLLISFIVKELGGKTSAVVIACLAFLLSPAYLRSNSLLQPVSFDQLFWLVSAYFIVRLINSGNSIYWLWIMIAWGIGFMNKYLIAGYALSFLIALAITPYRKLLFSKNFFYGVALAFLIVLPNIIWQIQHNLPVIHHLTELSQNQLVNVSAAGFLFDQVMMNLPALAVWLTGLVVFSAFKSERKYQLLAIASMLVILLLLLTHGKSYYTLGAYTLLFAMGGYAIEKYYSRFFKAAVIILIILLSIPVLPYSLPLLSLPAMEKYSAPMAEATNRWEDGETHSIPQDYADMTGWKKLSEIVIATYNSLPPKVRENCAIYAENYGQAGAIYFYGFKKHIPRPVSFSDNFLLWAPDSISTENLIYVNDELGDIPSIFEEYELKGEVNDKYFRENGVKVFFCSNPKDVFKTFYKNKVKELKSRYEK